MSKNDLINLETMTDPFWNDFFYPFYDRTLSHKHGLKTDILEDDKNFSIIVEVPGFNKEDISINLENGYLIVSAEKKDYLNDSAHKRIHQEIYFGKISRSYYVGNVNHEQIKAKLVSGTLTIVVPKQNKELSKTNSIQIE